VWLSKVTDTSDSEPTEAMEFGSRAEAMLARWFEDRTLHTIGGEQTWCTHPTEPWALCTVDGFIFDGPNADSLDDAVAVAEWKTTGDTVAEWADKVPNHYACQATWTMYVTGFPAVYFGVLHLAYGRPAFRVYEFHRDADDEAFVVEWCRRFWYEQVVAGVPPGIDNHEATTKALKDQWPEGHGGTKEADLDAIELVEECLYHRAQVKAAEADQQQADNRLIALLGDDIELAAAGRTLATRKPQERTTVDTAALRKAWPDLVRDFEKTTTSRTLLVKKPKEK
jgi:predicted phage-related endonuclease